MSDKLISKEILDRALKALNALTKQKIDVEKERAEQVETLLNQAIVKVEAMLGGKSLKYLTQAEYDALTDEQKQNDSIVYNITDADFSHNHDDLYYNILEINTLLEGKSNVGHAHDDLYYTETELDAKIIEINKKINDSVQDETDRASLAESNLQVSINNTIEMFGGKSLRYLTQAEYDALTDEQRQDESIAYMVIDASDEHDHDDLYYSKNEIDVFLENVQAKDHAHDDLYYTETEINAKIVEINEKINESVQGETDRASLAESNLQVNIDNTIAMLGGKSLRYVTQAEYDALTDEQKQNESIAYTIIDSSDEHNHDDSYYSKDEIDVFLGNIQFKEHNHDDLYYTESEIDEKIVEINESIQDEADRATTAENSLQIDITNTVKMFDGRSLKYITQAEYDDLSYDEKMNKTITYIITDAENENDMDNYYTKEEVDITINEVNTEIDLVEAMFDGRSIKYMTQAEYDELTYEQKTDNTVAYMITDADLFEGTDLNNYYTKDETDVAINEVSTEIDLVEAMLGGRSLRYITQAEYDELTYEQKTDNTVAYMITDADLFESYSKSEIDNKFINVDTSIATFTAELDKKLNISDHGTHLALGTSADNAYYGDKGKEAYDHSQSAHAPFNAQKNSDITKAEIEAKLTGDITSHKHDDSYYKKAETYTKTEIEEIKTNLETGITTGDASTLSSAKTYADQKIAALVDSAPDAMNTLNKLATAINNHQTEYDTYISTVAANITTAKSDAIAEAAKKDTALHTAISAEIDADVEIEKDRAMSVEAQLQAAINNHGTHLALGTSASNAYYGDKGKEAYDHSQSAHAPVNAQKNSDITKAEIEAKLTGEITTHKHDGSYYKKTETYTKTEIEEIKTNLETSITTGNASTLSSAKTYADQKITALVNSAPEAMNTLNELATAINNHQTEYDAYVSTVSANIATAKSEAIAEAAKKDTALHTTISAEIDADVKAEKDRAEAAESVLQTAINGKAASGHIHDDRYYTETEVNGLIEDVNETINTNVTTLTTEVNKKLNKSDHGAHLALGTTSSTAFRGDYGNTAYNHSQAAHAPVNAQKNSDITKAEIEAKLTGSITSHNHNGQYYTETEINNKITTINDTIDTKEATLQAAINGKAPSSHSHNVITSQDTRSVNTSPKEVPNGLSVHLKFNSTDGLDDGGTYHSTLMIKGWNDKSGGPWGQLAVTQNNNLYFRSSVASSDTDWNAWKKVSLDGHTHSSYQPKDNTITAVSVSGGKLTLTKDKRQYCANVPSGTTIAFPSTTAFLEINLYFATSGNMSLNFPDSTKWRIDPNIETASAYLLTATYVNSAIGWMAEVKGFTA